MVVQSGVPGAVLREAATHSGDKVRLLNLHVLVIDDDETVRSGMQHLLRDWGAGCDAAGSIEEALVLAHAPAPADLYRAIMQVLD